MTDERHGAPSASTIHRTDNCPGWMKFSAAFPPMEAGEDAIAGTRIAEALEHGPHTEQWEALTALEQQTAAMCWNQTLSVIGQWAEVHDDNADVEAEIWDNGYKEVRLGLTVLGKSIPTDGSKAKFIVTGKSDFYALRNDTALVIDHKSGRGEVIESSANPQLRANAVLVWLAHPGVEEVSVAIIQPWVGKPQMARFDGPALHSARDWLTAVIRKEQQATAEDRCAGEWCKYCPCAGGCPTLDGANVTTLAPLNLDTLPEDKAKEALFARAMAIEPETLLEMMDRRYLMTLAASAIEGAIRTRVEAGDPVICAEWALTEGTKVRNITDAAKAFEALQGHGLTLTDMWSAVKVAISPLETALRIKSGKKTTKDGKESSHYNLSVEDAKQTLTETLTTAGALELKQNQPSLKRTKSID